MKSTSVLIAGGGLAGLSTAYHLARASKRPPSCIVVEKEARVGGRCGSVTKDGFTFDHTGHLLHLHDPYGKALILRLLKDNLSLLDRSSWIHSHGTLTRYPFQANTFGLPPDVVADCVVGFMKQRYRPPAAVRNPSFESWYSSAFGPGIAKHFMRPYNEKLYLRHPSRMTTEWQGRFLPRPEPEEVLYGALVDQKKFFGYNACFRYPKRGGCQALPDALAARVPGVRLRARLTAVDFEEKVAVVEGLGELRYERLVSTMPMPELLDMAVRLPAAVRRARRKLRHVSVQNLNIGVRRSGVFPGHWIYFPERRYPFYRTGFCGNFSPSLAPKGCSSMYIEVSTRPGEKVDRRRLETACLRGLRSAGILRSSDKLAARVWIPIDCAYVIYDRDRGPALKTITEHLSRRGVESIGRWGGWKYSFMEETLLDGRRCAERLLGRSGEEHDSRSPLQALR